MRALFPIALSVVLGSLTAPAHASSVQAFTAVVGGSNTLCGGAGGPDPAITSFFPVVGDFGLLTDPGGNSIGTCGLSGGIGNLTAPAGPLSSATTLATTPYSSYPANSVSGSAAATAQYGSVSISTSTTVNGVEGPNGLAESAAFGIVSDGLTVSCGGCTMGYIAFDFTLNGSLTVESGDTGGGAAEVNVQAGDDANETIFYSNLEGSSVSAAGIENIAGTLEAGQPVPGCVIGIGTYTCTNGTLQTYLMPVSFSADIPFSFGLIAETAAASQTVTADPPSLSLSGIQVYDAGGNLLSGSTFTSDSGSTYGADGFESAPPSTPEPATFLPMAAGLIFLGFRSRRFLK